MAYLTYLIVFLSSFFSLNKHVLNSLTVKVFREPIKNRIVLHYYTKF